MLEPYNLIKDFIDEKLHGDLQGLVDYDFAQLRGDRKYGACGTPFDCDNTILARAIYSIVFDDVWKDMNYNTLQTKKYRGDTINSFNTIFGKPTADGGYLGLKRFNPDGHLLERVQKFHSQYHTIGNMMVLPNASIGRYSLNTFRGSYHLWKDYMDQFVIALHKYLICPEEKGNAIFLQLMELNRADFKPYFTEEGFRLLMSKLLLDDYIDKEGKPLRIFDIIYHWDRRLTRDSYIEHVTQYLDFVEPFIEKRGTRIVEILQSRI